jgi:DNA-binding Lrp family transcriptional regulator
MSESDDHAVDSDGLTVEGPDDDRTDGSALIQKRLGLIDDGMLDDVTIRIDYDAFDYRTVLVWLTVKLDVVDDCIDRLRTRPEFVTMYEISDSPNVFAVAKFPSERAVGACLKELLLAPDVRSVAIDSVEEVVAEGVPIDEASPDSPIEG